MTDDLTLEPAASKQKRWSKLERFYERAGPYIPWVSLALSIGGVWAVDHHETQGPWIAGAAALGWVVLVVVNVLHQALEAPTAGTFHKVARFGADWATQSIMHLSLFFSAPFYFEASAWTVAQCAFGVVFIAVTAVTLWDPLCSKVVAHPVGGPLVMAFASFVGWNAALPMLGVANKTAVLASALSVGVAIPIARYLQGARGTMLRGALIAGVLLPTFLLLGGIRAIPPAPLRVVHASIGTQVVERELVDPTLHFKRAPGTLICFTAIRAPLGLKDELEHVWTHNGKVLSRIPLNLRGGRRQGFRTWSRLHVSPRASGMLRCDVLTRLGQNLGGARVRIGS